MFTRASLQYLSCHAQPDAMLQVGNVSRYTFRIGMASILLESEQNQGSLSRARNVVVLCWQPPVGPDGHQQAMDSTAGAVRSMLKGKALQQLLTGLMSVAWQGGEPGPRFSCVRPQEHADEPHCSPQVY